MDVEDEEDLSEIEFIPPPVTAIVGLPMHQGEVLEWQHEVTLIGNKCPNPRIHICESCDNPILVYGRLIPCKHVFCLSCAQTGGSFCAKCNEKVVRVEQAGVGTIFQCRRVECRRTYLSQRDLLAHLKHRHSKRHKANKV